MSMNFGIGPFGAVFCRKKKEGQWEKRLKYTVKSESILELQEAGQVGDYIDLKDKQVVDTSALSQALQDSIDERLKKEKTDWEKSQATLLDSCDAVRLAENADQIVIYSDLNDWIYGNELILEEEEKERISEHLSLSQLAKDCIADDEYLYVLSDGAIAGTGNV